jgi:hypothetical protein
VYPFRFGHVYRLGQCILGLRISPSLIIDHVYISSGKVNVILLMMHFVIWMVNSACNLLGNEAVILFVII